jgi:hypothetical protein
MSDADDLADLNRDENELDFSNMVERATALVRVKLSRRSHRGWMTSAIAQAERVMAAALGPPVVHTQLMATRLLNALDTLDKRYISLLTAHQRILMLDQAPAHQQELTDNVDNLNQRYGDMQTRLYEAIQASAVPEVVQNNGGGGGGGAAVTRPVVPLQPFTLTNEHNPTETADWFVRFRGYFQASRMELSTLSAQRLYMQNCIQPQLWLVVKQHLLDATPIFHDANADDDDQDSCERFLQRELNQRYPLIRRRYDLFTYAQGENQSYTDFAANIRDLGAAAQLETMEEGDYYAFRLITGITDMGLRSKILEIPDENFNQAEVDRIARQYETAKACGKALGACGTINKARAVHQKQTQQSQPAKTGRPLSDFHGNDKYNEMRSRKLCIRCTEPAHQGSSECRHKESTCHKCKKLGHIIKACTSTGQPKESKANQVTDNNKEDVPRDNYTNYVSQEDTQTPSGHRESREPKVYG